MHPDARADRLGHRNLQSARSIGEGKRMRGPVVDIVVLSLLILFFGIQQNSRPQKYYRLWFVGWIFILLSYAVWAPIVRSQVLERVQGVARYDLILAGTLAFLLSFLAAREGLRRGVAKGLLVGVPTVLVLDAMRFAVVPKAVLMTAVLGWGAFGLRAGYLLIPKHWGKARVAIYVIGVVFAVVELSSVWQTGGYEMFNWTLAEVVFCSAILYMSIAGRRSVAAWVGTFGFLMWGVFYLIAAVMLQESATVQALYSCWTLPKYLVAFSMILKTFEDSTAEKVRMAEEYRELYDDFRMMFEGHPNPMWVYAEEGGRILAANESAVRRYGYSAEDFLGMKFGDLDVTNDAEATLLDTLYREQKDGYARHQFKDGRKIWVNLSDSGIKFRGTDAFFQIARDVTDRVETTKVRLHQASHDMLTGLPNRALLADRIQQCMKRCEREGRKATLLTIDVDHFKDINDTYGHPMGDECLKIVAARLSSKIRQVDTIARVGGEEFAAIVGGLHIAEDAEKVAQSLLGVFDEPLWLGDVDVSVTVSIGIAIYPDDATEAEVLTRLSDEALYAAKRSGRNQAVTWASMVEGVRMVKELGDGVGVVAPG